MRLGVVIRRVWNLKTMACLVCLGLAACGGSGGASFPVDGSKQLSSLTADEVQKICDEMKRVTDARFTQHDICMASAVVTKIIVKGDAQKCKTTYDACMQKPVTYSCSLVGSKALASCAATVDEFERCYNDMLAPAETFYNSMSCSMTDADFKQAAPTLPSSCKSLESTCPGLVSG